MAVKNTDVSNNTAGGSTELTVPGAARTRKRGLTVSAPTPADLKKPKVEHPPLPEPQNVVAKPAGSETVEPKPEVTSKVNSISKDDEAEGGKEEEEEDDVHPYRRPVFHRLPSDGPVTFLTSSDSLSTILQGEPDSYMVPKSTMLDVMSKTAGLSEEEAEDIAGKLLSAGGYWDLDMDMSAAETKEAELLCEKLRTVSKNEPEDQWWYEVIVQREKPAEGEAALEFKWYMFLNWHHIAEEDKGSWWITDFAIPDEELNKAATIIPDHAPMY